MEGLRTAEALLDTAASVVPDSAFDVWSLLRGRRAVTFALHGRAAEASREADVSVNLAQRARDVDAEADAFRIVGQILQYRGAWDSALVALHRSQDLYQRARNRSALATSLIWHAQVLGGLGRYGEAREVMQRALAEGEATHNPAAKANANRAFGVLAQMLGDWPAAATHLRESAAISAASGDSSSVMVTRKFLANVALATGDLRAAKRLTEAQLTWTRQTADAMGQYEAQQTLAGIAIRERDWSAATKASRRGRPGETAVFLVGDLHARTKPGAPWNHEIVWAGVRLRAQEPRLVLLANRFLGGEAWVCLGNTPSDCGIKTVKGRAGAPDFCIERFAATDSVGLDGMFDIGPASPSLPAREDRRGRR